MRWSNHVRLTPARLLLRALLALALILFSAWGALALWFQLAGSLAVLAAAAWCLLILAATMLQLWGPGGPARAPVVAAAMVAAGLLLAWWLSIAPSHDRQWADDVARLLEADVDGDRVTLRNVRDFEWRTETDYTPRWETRHYDLRQLASADLILSYWMGPHIAHTLVSFGFNDGQKLVFSLEIRKERHETFSAAGGFFRKFEQVIVAADERDIVRTRSNARGEQVYLYRLRTPPERLRTVFLEYLRRAGQLRAQPAFYNTVTSNCTTILYELGRQISPDLPLDYRLLLSGHFAQYVHDQGALAPGLSFGLLQQRGHINARARQAGAGGDGEFSRAIRAGVPGVPAWEAP